MTTWHIYLITCTAEGEDCGKQYIGITKTSIYDRFGTHFRFARKPINEKPNMMPMAVAMRAHWEFEFKVEPICDCLNKEDALDTEAMLIGDYNCRVPHGFNLSGRGSGYHQATASRFHTPEARAKNAKTKKARYKNDPAHRVRLLQLLRDGNQKRRRGKGALFGSKSSFTRDRRQRSLL